MSENNEATPSIPIWGKNAEVMKMKDEAQPDAGVAEIEKLWHGCPLPEHEGCWLVEDDRDRLIVFRRLGGCISIFGVDGPHYLCSEKPSGQHCTFVRYIDLHEIGKEADHRRKVQREITDEILADRPAPAPDAGSPDAAKATVTDSEIDEISSALARVLTHGQYLLVCRLAAAARRAGELEKALNLIKGIVCGDATPNWADHWRTTGTRMRIANIVDETLSLLAQQPQRKDGK